MTDTQWDTYEVFHQTKKGDPHIHVGSYMHPIRNGIADGRDQFARRLKCVSLWVVRTGDVTATDDQKPDFFAQTTDRVTATRRDSTPR